MGKINAVDFDAAIRGLETGKTQSVYFLLGNDQYLQQHFIQTAESVFFGNEPPVKQYLLPDDMKGQEILDTLNSTDLFTSKKLFVVRNPTSIQSKKCKDELLDYCKNPLDNHCLIISYDDWSDKLAFIKALIKITQPISCSTPFENQLEKWIRHFFKENGMEEISKDIVQSFIDIGGDSLMHIKNEVDKVCLALESPGELTSEFVEQFGGWKREYKQYEFFRYLGRKNLPLSLKLGQALVKSDINMLGLIYPLTEFFQKLLFIKMPSGTKPTQYSFSQLSKKVNEELELYANQYKKEEITSALNHLGEIDKRIKTSTVNDQSVITEFIFTTLGNG